MTKTFYKVVSAVLVAGAIAAGVCCLGHASRDKVSGKWFGNFKNISEWSWTDEKPQDDTSNDNVAIASFDLSKEDFAAYGVSDNAISAGVLTAEYTPSNTTNKRTGWSWRWAGNDWSKDKVLTEFVDFAAGANYSPECTYSVLQPFGDTIIVEATSRANSALKATINIDYVARYDYIWGCGSLDLNYGEDLNLLSGLYSESNRVYSAIPDSFVVSDFVFKVPSVAANKSDYGDLAEINYISDFLPSAEQETFRTTGVISWSRLIGYLGGAETMAKIAIDFDDEYPFEVSAKITCYYKGKELYSFSDYQYFGLSSSCIEQVSVLPTDIVISDGANIGV